MVQVQQEMEMKVKSIGLFTAVILGAMYTIWATPSLSETTTRMMDATVLSVEDIYETQQRQIPRESCTVVEVPVYGAQGGNGAFDIGSAIIGGIIGNNMKGEDGGGAAGAIIGGLLGAEVKKQNQVITGYRKVNQCTTTYDIVREEVLTGFKVVYEIFGVKGQTFKYKRPRVGDALPVVVSITAR